MAQPHLSCLVATGLTQPVPPIFFSSVTRYSFTASGNAVPQPLALQKPTVSFPIRSVACLAKSSFFSVSDKVR
eukprot:COSAG06_NODE_1098_length_10712_cov_8.529633_14_plen_73_part_00